jgi:hypothetical protein
MKKILFFIAAIFCFVLLAEDRDNGWKQINYKQEINDTTKHTKPVIIGENGSPIDSIVTIGDTTIFYFTDGEVRKMIEFPGAGGGSGLTKLQIEGTNFDSLYADTLYVDTNRFEGNEVILKATKVNGKGKVGYIKTVQASTVLLFKTDSGTVYYSVWHIDSLNQAINDSIDSLRVDIPAQISTEQIQDIVGGMVSGNTETNITVTYQDGDGTLDFVANAGGGSGTSVDTTIAVNDTSFFLRKFNYYDAYELVDEMDTLFMDTTGMWTDGIVRRIVYTSATDSFRAVSQLPIRKVAAKDTFYNVANLLHVFEYRVYSDLFIKEELIDTITADMTAPILDSAVVYDGNPDSIELFFSEAVTITTDGWDVDSSGSVQKTISSVGGSGTASPYFLMSADLIADGVYDISYSSTSGSTTDASGNELVTLTDSSITNYLEETGLWSIYDLGDTLLAYWPDNTVDSNISVTDSRVTQWDEVIADKHFVQATESRRPYDRNDGIFFSDGSTHGLASSFARNDNDIYIFFVAKRTTVAENKYLLYTPPYSFQQRQTGNRNSALYHSGTVTIQYGTPIDTNFHVYCMLKNDASSVYRTDNTGFSVIPTTATFNVTAVAAGNSTNYNSGSVCVFKEALVTQGNLSNLTINRIYNWLNDRHSVSTNATTLGTYNYNTFVIDSTKVVPDTNDLGVTEANTGLDFDEGLGEIYIVSGFRDLISVYDTSLALLREISADVHQGLAWNRIDSVFYSWASTTILNTINKTGTTTHTQTGFDPYLNSTAPGGIACDFSGDSVYLWVKATAKTSIIRYSLNPATGDFVNRTVLNVPFTTNGDGMEWDSRDNTLWTTGLIVDGTANALINISKTGEIIKQYVITHHPEGMAINVERGLIYVNHPLFYHGGTHNGNVLFRYYPDFFH